MSVLVILILASLLVATVFLFAFVWAVRSGQYEDTSTPSLRVLTDDAGGRLVDTHQRNDTPHSSA